MSRKGFLYVFVVILVPVLVMSGIKGFHHEIKPEVQEKEKITVEKAWTLVEDQAQLYRYLKRAAPSSCNPEDPVVSILRGKGSDKLSFLVYKEKPPALAGVYV